MIGFNFRRYYQPLQPTAKASDSSVFYQEMLPAASLQDFIYCYWQLKSKQPLMSPYQYRVVADGCVDLFFDVNNPLDSQVMGFCNGYTQFPLSGNFNYVGVRFFPAVFPRLFNIKATEISDRTEELQLVIPDLVEHLIVRVNQDKNLYLIAGILDKYFYLKLTKTIFEWDGRFYQALLMIMANNGNIHLEKEIDTGLSPRQLRRLFQFYIGQSGKAFSQVVQFQKLLASAKAPRDILKQKTYFDMGYYDQSHFIKNFKRFYGVSPKNAR